MKERMRRYGCFGEGEEKSRMADDALAAVSLVWVVGNQKGLSRSSWQAACLSCRKVPDTNAGTKLC